MPFSESKYIVFDNGMSEFPVVFPTYINHDSIANGVGVSVVGAGFVSIFERGGVIHVSCYGRSTSLDVSSRDEDRNLIRKQIICS